MPQNESGSFCVQADHRSEMNLKNTVKTDNNIIFPLRAARGFFLQSA